MDERTEYKLNTGHEPQERFPKDHPDRWQWDYSGKPAERDQLLEKLGVYEEQPEQEESLF